MKLADPFAWLSDSHRTSAFGVLLILTLVVMFTLQNLGEPLKTAAAPFGIVSYELAGTMSNAQKMIDSWGTTGRVYAGLNLGFDYLFLVLYPLWLGLGCVIVARAFAPRVATLSALGIVLAWALLIAGGLDAIENFSLIQMLLGARQEIWATLAQLCAVPKFLIVGMGILYVILGTIGTRISKASAD